MNHLNTFGYTLQPGATGLIPRGAVSIAIYNASGFDVIINGGTLPDGSSINLENTGYLQDEVSYQVDVRSTGIVSVFEQRPIEQ